MSCFFPMQLLGILQAYILFSEFQKIKYAFKKCLVLYNFSFHQIIEPCSINRIFFQKFQVIVHLDLLCKKLFLLYAVFLYFWWQWLTRSWGFKWLRIYFIVDKLFFFCYVILCNFFSEMI